MFDDNSFNVIVPSDSVHVSSLAAKKSSMECCWLCAYNNLNLEK
jgi:hypothetical protein